MLRKVNGAEAEKRGCWECADILIVPVNTKYASTPLLMCRHKDCPYKVLDRYATIGEFYADARDKTLLVVLNL